jgi:hypothetical protein
MLAAAAAAAVAVAVAAVALPAAATLLSPSCHRRAAAVSLPCYRYFRPHRLPPRCRCH